jgi:hypothetical protein
MTAPHEPLELPALPGVTGELLAALAWRYAVPRCCRVCGAPLVMVNSGERRYACTSDAASPLKNPLRSGTWRQALDHWNESVMYDPPPGDPAVLALVAEVRRLREVSAP